jgi:hypothetical protein
MSTKFAQNFMVLHEIDVTPNGTATYKRIAEGIESGERSRNDEVDTKQYLSGSGNASSDVTGMQKTITYSGNRVTNDDAQNYVFSVADETGDARKTNLRVTLADGSSFSGSVTLCNIDDGTGGAGEKEGISFEAHFNGKPNSLAPQLAPALTSVVAVGSVIGSTKFTATPAVGNKLGYRLTSTSLGSFNTSQFMSGYVSYTSGANITAVAGQILTMFEINANERLVNIAVVTLASGDILAV